MEKDYLKILQDVNMQNLFRFASYVIDFFKYGKLDYDINKYSFSIVKNVDFTGFQNVSKNVRYFADAKNYISLNYQEIPIAFIGFDINRKIFGKNEVIVKQLQGAVFKNSDGDEISNNFYLNNFDWKKTLVAFLEIYVKRVLKYKKIIILCGFNVNWSKIYENENNWHIYDKTAKELGYKIKQMKNRKENWEKILN